MEQKSSKKKHVLIIFLVLVILLGACSFSVTLYVKNFVTEGIVEPEKEPIPSISPSPDKSTFPTYLNDILLAKTADSSAVKTNLSSEVSVDADSVAVEGGNANADVIKYTLNSFTDTIREFYPSHEGDFGDKFDKIPDCVLKADDISEFEFRQGEINPDDKEGTADEESFYYFTAKTNEFDIIDDNASKHAFPYYSSADLKPAVKNVTDSLSEMLAVDMCEIKAIGSTIEGKTNRLTDKLQYLDLSVNYAIKLNISFKGDYSSLGNCILSFKLTVKEKYSYAWAGAEIAKDSISLSLNEEDVLPLSVTISDKATEKDYKISFKSSNDAIVSIDKDGNITGTGISDTPATVTVTFEYLGKTYTDSCEVYVTVPVKHIKTQPEKINLAIGETEKLSCKITPDDATIKTLEWRTEDDSIATVSSDGTVKAVGNGTVKVYAVSLDGYFRSSCVVTVGEVK